MNQHLRNNHPEVHAANKKARQQALDTPKPLSCNYKGCGKSFKYIGNFSAHIKKNHPELQAAKEKAKEEKDKKKLFACSNENCPNGPFSGRKSLIKHYKSKHSEWYSMQSGELPLPKHKCDIGDCPKVYPHLDS